jgi:hypothetical protein
MLKGFRQGDGADGQAEYNSGKYGLHWKLLDQVRVVSLFMYTVGRRVWMRLTKILGASPSRFVGSSGPSEGDAEPDDPLQLSAE